MEVQRSRCYFFSCEPVMSRGKKKETRAPYVQIQSPEAGLCRCSICACVFNPLPLWRCTILYLRPVRWGHSHPDTTHRHAWPCQSEDWESSAKVFNACIMFHLDPPPPLSVTTAAFSCEQFCLQKHLLYKMWWLELWFQIICFSLLQKMILLLITSSVMGTTVLLVGTVLDQNQPSK